MLSKKLYVLNCVHRSISPDAFANTPVKDHLINYSMRSTLGGGPQNRICDSPEPDTCGAAATCNWSRGMDSEAAGNATDQFAYR